eukprot:TRINITY_DN4633_c1_g1_i1.p1 TRINITY_DN4633_c1_g1~~TRINITY_DN4633_c1_g1_i1.p1  ORF type:complete len:324 (+),score=50.25 TRINITY_DN4633_c1_g1_i1:59-1030(+)
MATLAEQISQKSESALDLIKDMIYRTPLAKAYSLEAELGPDTNVLLKLESEQVTGSFKARGAAYKIAMLEGDGEVTTASTGNHAMATAHALQCFKRKGTVYLPKTAAEQKVEKIKQRAGDRVELRFYGSDCMQAEVEARRVGGADFISPYNDIQVITGQSTIGVEIHQQFPGAIDYVLLSVGGGGMISGVAAYLKSVVPSVKIIGCQPSQDAAMHRCVAANKILEIDCLPTLSDGTAGNVEPGSITLPLCASLVDSWVEVSEEQIASAMKWIFDKESKLIEGAAAVPVAALLADPEKFKGKTSVIVICGGNIGAEKILKIYGH